jgi:hypothetical protein
LIEEILDLFDQNKHVIKRVGKDAFVVMPYHYLKVNKIKINDLLKTKCPFFKDGKCLIDGYQPQFCKLDTDPSEYGESYDLLRYKVFLDINDKPYLTYPNKLRGSDVWNIKTMKKYFKNMKEDMIFYTVVSLMDMVLKDYKENKEDVIVINEHLRVEPKYSLVKIKDNKGKETINAIKQPYFITDIKELQPFITLINKLYSRFYHYPIEYLEVLADKVGRIMRGVNLEKCRDDWLFNVVLALAIVKKYKENFKNKSNKWKGMLDDESIYGFFRYYINLKKKENGEEEMDNFNFLDFVRYLSCESMNLDRVYNALIKQK